MQVEIYSLAIQFFLNPASMHLPLMARTSTPITMTVTVLFQVLWKAIRISAVPIMTMRFTLTRPISAGLELYFFSV